MNPKPVPLSQNPNLYDGLQTLTADGKPPETTMGTAQTVQSMVTRAIQSDQQERDWKRSRIKGLVDGNPPYRQQDLRAAGRADECNVNWRIGKYFISLVKGMLYDVVTEAETFATVKLANENSQNDEWGQIATQHFDWLQRQDQDWDFTIQQSQGQMGLYGTGPILFEDEYDWRPWSAETKMLLVPDLAKSNINRWQWCAVIVEYSPDQLYGKIANADIAKSRGWDVEATRNAIMAAHPLTRTGSMYQHWSWHQDMLKTGSYYYADQSKMVRAAHFYCREFPRDDEDEGMISEAVIDLDNAAGTGEGAVSFLYRKLHRYSRWQEIIHPMYWDHDLNGLHYSVTGLGVEMFSALEYENRLLCRLADDAFAPKLFFKPSSPSDKEKLSIAQIGRYGLLPANLEAIQQAINPLLQDGIAMSREVQSIVSSNLSQFRSNSISRDRGNPPTATQVNYEAGEQAKMGKTQLARIYEQYDWLYAEKFRRATSDKITRACRGGKLALEFQEKCKRAGIPLSALRNVESVRATRVVGQGSAFMRQQALEFLLGLLGTLPESGRQNLIRDVVASRAGQSHVDRYAPRMEVDPSVLAQQADAAQWIGAMKEGVAFVPVPTQIPTIYAATFLQAAEGALQSVQQGADPMGALAFLDLAIPATEAQLQRMANDKSRQNEFKQFSERLAQVNQFKDQITAQVMEQQRQAAEQQAEMAQYQQGTDPTTQIGLAKVAAKERVDTLKTQVQAATKAKKQNFDMGLAAARARQDMSIADAKTASEIQRSFLKDTAKPPAGKKSA